MSDKEFDASKITAPMSICINAEVSPEEREKVLMLSLPLVAQVLYPLWKPMSTPPEAGRHILIRGKRYGKRSWEIFTSNNIRHYEAQIMSLKTLSAFTPEGWIYCDWLEEKK